MAIEYTGCKCRDCFEIAISDDMSDPDFCRACEDAGCSGDGECAAPSAYGCDESEDA